MLPTTLANITFDVYVPDTLVWQCPRRNRWMVQLPSTLVKLQMSISYVRKIDCAAIYAYSVENHRT
jgi:hypothetical protein